MFKNLYNNLVYILVILGFSFGTVFGQTNLESIDFRSKIVDSSSLKPLIYASIYNVSSNTGTTSNLKGYFKLTGNKIGDTIVISYIGYENEQFIISPKFFKKTIHLKPKTSLLNQIVIIGENKLLYTLIKKTKKNRSKKSKTAKTYMSVKSNYNKEQIELVECYYNGIFAGYNIEELHLKNGRIALNPDKNKLFNSTGTSIAIFNHKLLKSTDYYPHNPFDLSKRKLKKYYRLKLISKYIDSDSNTIFEIEYKPKKNKQNYFSGIIWIDSTNMQIKKITLNKTDSKFHPFKAIGLDSVKRVDLSISKIFESVEGKQFTKAINFNYKITYKPIDSVAFDIETNAFLYAYNYDEKFILPKFKYHNSKYQDYRQITATPYNSFFWNNINEFKVEEGWDKNNKYVNETIVGSKNRFRDYSVFDVGFFEQPYIFWSNSRIGFKDNEDFSKYNKQVPSDRYNFNIQIFLDINELKDSIHILTETIFDPFDSYFRYDQTNETRAFFNMYFDIMEIQRRKIVDSIGELDIVTVEKVKSIYDFQMNEAKRIGKQFFQDVKRGTIKEKMIEWNNYINEELHIDNLALLTKMK